jgi:pimeloyl-ACP methyl ester carboxylesterase
MRAVNRDHQVPMNDKNILLENSANRSLPNRIRVSESRFAKMLWPELPPEVVSRQILVSDLDVHILECLPLGVPFHSLDSNTAPTRKSPLVILLHGFPELAYSWRKVLAPLARAGYHVIAPDQRGYGLTVPVASSGDASTAARCKLIEYEDDLRPYHLLNLAADIVHLIHALGYDKAHAVVGHDFGSSVAAWTALVRPDMVGRLVLMSAPFGGPPKPHEAGSVTKKERSKAYSVDSVLKKMVVPRKHYTVYYSTPEANANMCSPPEGLAEFLRAYYHVKSADWEGNKTPLPARLPLRFSTTGPQPPSNEELLKVAAEALTMLPPYYIMPADVTMPEAVRPYFPSSQQPPACAWLTDGELAIYVSVYKQTGFQGGLNRYRSMTDETWNAEPGVRALCGKKIEVPVRFIAGAMDWGTWQYPGVAEAMRSESVVKGGIEDKDFVIVEGAGHWVQQEKPDETVYALLQFFE